MLRRFLVLIACLAACSAGKGAEPALAADFTLPDAAGSKLSLSELRGSVVYLDFWASWCAPCLKSFPWMNQMQARYAGRGLRIVAVNLDQKRADADKFLSRMPVGFRVVFDASGQTPKAYGVKAMPSSYLIDRQGRVRHVHLGFRESSQDALEAQIKQLVEGH